MKIITLIITLFFISYICNAQPLATSAITIDTIYLKDKIMYFDTNNGGINYILSKKEKSVDLKKSHYKKALIAVNYISIFTYKKDTMKIKLLFDEYSPYNFEIKKMNFQKGEYIIDLKKYMKNKGFIIKNFPYDCIIYRKEE